MMIGSCSDTGSLLDAEKDQKPQLASPIRTWILRMF